MSNNQDDKPFKSEQFIQSYLVTDEDIDLRLDRWFSRHFPKLNHGRLEKLLRKGQVRLDGKKIKSNFRLSLGQVISFPPIQNRDTQERVSSKKLFEISDEDHRLIQNSVLFKDDDIIIINKPPGLAVQGGTNMDRHLDAMLDSLRFGLEQKPKLVHRLDKDTSGLLVLGRTPLATARMAASFRSREAQKWYWALVVGVPDYPQGRIDVPLAKMTGKMGDKVSVNEEDGKRAVTYYRIVNQAFRKAAWLELEPKTGRTHQLRVHCAVLGTPIQGDGKYGGQEAFLSGYTLSRKLHLHARAIRMPHPRQGMIEIIAPPPEHLLKSLDFFGFSLQDAGVPFQSFEDEK
jgi:23S rRNA pseudouridine955/2504/2580 synthase